MYIFLKSTCLLYILLPSQDGLIVSDVMIAVSEYIPLTCPFHIRRRKLQVRKSQQAWIAVYIFIW